ncbi:hypothetical protein Daus18300_008273 [Diaporthe australafricana]|uniref:Uncharacterized protein n=1 Tax=Diaporthe australafricana TaxID=127596 RepID=A0ABR3WIY4_9PEZI
MTGMTGDGATNAVLINAVRSSEELPATACIPSEQGRDKDKGMGKDGMIQSDASSAVNAALSVLGTTHQKASREGLLSRWRDQRDMDSKPLKRTTQEYGDTWAVESVEVTPETGRVNKRRLSEDDQVSPFPGSPDGDEDSSSEPRVGNAESSGSLLRPGNAAAARARAQPFQGTPPAQARLSNSQPFSHQSAPYSSPANTSLPSLESYIGYSPPRPPNAVQRAQHQGSTTPIGIVTAEEMQEFRLQYRSTPVLFWPREYEISDTHATVALQALKLRGLSLTELGLVTQPTNPTQSATDTPTLRGSGHPGGAAQPGHDGHAPEYLLDRFIERYEATRTHEGFPPNPAASRARAMLAAGRGFQPRDDDAHGGALASGPVRSIVIQIDDDPADFGITEITCRNARGETIVSRSARRPAQNNGNNSLALNTEIIDIHIEDDLVGAAESTTPAEKFRRLMNSSPTR